MIYIYFKISLFLWFKSSPLIDKITPQEREPLYEDDEFDLEDSEEYYDDEIDLEKISASDYQIKPEEKVSKNAFGGLRKKLRDRSVKFGSGNTHMPDFKTMVSTGRAGRSQDTLMKPYDEDFLKNPFGNSFLESKKSLSDIIMGEELSEDDNYNGYRPSLGQSTHKMLEKMRDKIGMAPKLMNESL